MGFHGISRFSYPPTAESLLLDAIFSEHPSPSGACVNRSDFAFQIFQVTDLRNPQDSLSFQAFTSCSIKFEDQNISKWSNMNPSMSIYVLCLQKLSPWESILDPKIIPMCSFPQEMEMRQLDPVPQRIPQKLEFGSRGS